MRIVIRLAKADEERALEVHEKSTVIDSLAPRGGPLPYSPEIVEDLKEGLASAEPTWALRRRVLEKTVEHLDLNAVLRQNYIDLLRRSGVTAVSETIAPRYMCDPPHRFEGAIRGLSLTIRKLDILSHHLIKVSRAEDIRRAKSDGKYAILMNLQNAKVIGDEIENVDFFHRCGVRVLQLTYNLRNLVGTGCTERNDSGVSEFGAKVVERMNHLGMLIDLSHCGHETTMDAIELSRHPVAFTHTGCSSVFNHPRSKTDDELKAVAEKGGYVGIYAISSFLRRPPERATIEDIMNHVDYAVRLIGVDHVGIGTDYEQPYPESVEQLMTGRVRAYQTKVGFRPEHGIDPTLHTEGLEHWNMWPNITRGLVSRGYSDREISNIIGGNFLRILERVIG